MFALPISLQYLQFKYHYNTCTSSYYCNFFTATSIVLLHRNSNPYIADL